jgi:hypothetical protein
MRFISSIKNVLSGTLTKNFKKGCPMVHLNKVEVEGKSTTEILRE